MSFAAGTGSCGNLDESRFVTLMLCAPRCLRNVIKVEQTVYIGNLSYEVTEEDIKEVFLEYGNVEQIHLPVDFETNRQRRFAFIAMSKKEETAKAAKQLDGAEWMGRQLTVRIATDDEVTKLEPESGQRSGFGKVRIYNLSKELNLENKDIIDICRQLNIAVKSHASRITEADAERIKGMVDKYLAQQGTTQAKDEEFPRYKKQQILAIHRKQIRPRPPSKELPSVLDSPTPPRPPAKPQVNIYIGNLSYKVTEEDLNEVFSEYGTVRRVTIPKDRETGRPRGFGFVEMNTKTEAENAIDTLDGAEWMGRTLKVAQAKPRR